MTLCRNQHRIADLTSELRTQRHLTQATKEVTAFCFRKLLAVVVSLYCMEHMESFMTVVWACWARLYVWVIWATFSLRFSEIEPLFALR